MAASSGRLPQDYRTRTAHDRPGLGSPVLLRLRSPVPKRIRAVVVPLSR